MHPFQEKINEVNKEFTRMKRFESIMAQTIKSGVLDLTIMKSGTGIRTSLAPKKDETEEEFEMVYRELLERAENAIKNKTAQYTRPKGMYIFQALARLFNRAMSK